MEDICTDEFPQEMVEDRDPSDTPQRVVYLVVHCTATVPKTHWTKEDILRFFAEDNEWSRPGYRDFIDKEGILWNLRPYNNDDLIQYEEATWGARGYNWIAWHIAYDGGVNESLQPEDTRNDRQIQALANYITLIRTMFPHVIVLGHKDLPGVHKACPSFNPKEEYGNSLINLDDMFDGDLDTLD